MDWYPKFTFVKNNKISKIDSLDLSIKGKIPTQVQIHIWVHESISKDDLDFWELEMVLDEKYFFEAVFKSCAGPRERVQEEGENAEKSLC